MCGPFLEALVYQAWYSQCFVANVRWINVFVCGIFFEKAVIGTMSYIMISSCTVLSESGLSFGAVVHVPTCSIGAHRMCHMHAEMVRRKLPQGLFPLGLLKFPFCLNCLGFLFAIFGLRLSCLLLWV